MTVCAMKHEAFILRTKAGQWMFQVHRDGVETAAGRVRRSVRVHRGSTKEAFGHVEGLALVVRWPIPTN